MHPCYNFISFDDAGNWGWVPAPGKFRRDPFLDEKGNAQLPSEIGFEILSTGEQTTAWERVFDNGRVLITNQAGTSHEYGRVARITYLGPDNRVWAEYNAGADGITPRRK
jgi:hypothetical protein